MKGVKQKPTLDRPATYQIKVPGELDESWSDWVGGISNPCLMNRRTRTCETQKSGH
jgi:hypothetical protein